MSWDKTVTLVAQKGLSGAAGLLGLNLLFTGDLQGEGWLGIGLVGCFLVALAVVVEFLMWRESNHIFRERITQLRAEKQKTDAKLDAYDRALLSHLKQTPEGGSDVSA